MSKVICEICGTAYPETAEECPICGCTRDSAAALLADTGLEEEMAAAAAAVPFLQAGNDLSLESLREIYRLPAAL